MSTDIKNRNTIKATCEICNLNKSQFEKIDSNRVRKASDGFAGVAEKINHIYYNTKIGYSGINDIARKSEENAKSVKTYLESQNVYTLHKPIRKKFEKRIILGI